jgi:hypothetical protein
MASGRRTTACDGSPKSARSWRPALPHLRPLFETATKVGFELGRKEALEELARAIEALDGPMTGENTMSDYLVLAARIAREIGTKEAST